MFPYDTDKAQLVGAPPPERVECSSRERPGTGTATRAGGSR
jgi:hypothetical protein